MLLPSPPNYSFLRNGSGGRRWRCSHPHNLFLRASTSHLSLSEGCRRFGTKIHTTRHSPPPTGLTAAAPPATREHVSTTKKQTKQHGNIIVTICFSTSSPTRPTMDAEATAATTATARRRKSSKSDKTGKSSSKTSSKSGDGNGSSGAEPRGGGGGGGVRRGAAGDSEQRLLQREKHGQRAATWADSGRELGRNFAGGFGMMAEAYILFSFGNLGPIFEAAFVDCYNDTLPASASCQQAESSISYVEISGIIVSMLTFGFLAARTGRALGSKITAGIMAVGATLLALAYAPTDTGIFVFLASAVFVFALGVGGEYPLASARASERAEELKARHADRPNRGASVVQTFSMQGFGNFMNTVVIVVLIAATGQGECVPNLPETCDPDSLNVVWRVQYAVGAFFIILLYIGRLLYLRESRVFEKAQRMARKRTSQGSSGSPASSAPTGAGQASGAQPTSFVPEGPNQFDTLVRWFWARLLGTSLSWFVWDIVFYGNKLFSSTIIAAIAGPDATQYQIASLSLVNATVSLVGYWAAAAVVDRPWMGRVRLQLLGLVVQGVLFFICAGMYDTLTANPAAFQAVYFLSSFFGQFGPNCTTFLVASESFATEPRTVAHGLSAAMGKLGALVATLAFTFGGPGGTPLEAQDIFYVSAASTVLGAVITVLLVPDVTRLTLNHHDDFWDLIMTNKGDTYDGEAIKPDFLCLVERWMGRGAHYRPRGTDFVDQSLYEFDGDGESESGGSDLFGTGGGAGAAPRQEVDGEEEEEEEGEQRQALLGHDVAAEDDAEEQSVDEAREDELIAT